MSLLLISHWSAVVFILAIERKHTTHRRFNATRLFFFNSRLGLRCVSAIANIFVFDFRGLDVVVCVVDDVVGEGLLLCVVVVELLLLSSLFLVALVASSCYLGDLLLLK